MTKKKEVKEKKKNKVWTDADIQYLKDNYGVKSNAEIAGYLGIETESVRKHASRFGKKKEDNSVKIRIEVNTREEFIAVRDWFKEQGKQFDRSNMVAQKYPVYIIDAGTKLTLWTTSFRGVWDILSFETFLKSHSK